VEVALSKISGADPVEDRSDLSKIKNTEGDEEYVSAGEGRYLWENHGENIRYKGISDRELPVDTKVTYYLEGQEVTAHRIAGETGDVRIRFDYENKTDVPFMVLTAVLLSGDVFSDVEVENGRIIDFGDQKAVIGFAFPGLMDSLQLANYEPTEELDLPEYVEIEARAVDFALDFTATVVSTGLFDELEDEDLQDLEDMADDMDELTDASSELADAAGELADGGATFGEYLNQYFGGLSKISEVMAALGGTTDAEPSPESPPPATAVPDVSRLLPFLSSMGKDNEHTALLKALRPYLHGEREKRLDDSVKLLQLLQLLPLLQQGGLL
jgi:putative membrane protein